MKRLTTFTLFALTIVLLSSQTTLATDATANSTKSTTSPSPTASTTPKETTKKVAVTETDVTNARKKSDDALAAYKQATAADRLTKAKDLGAKLIADRKASLQQFNSNTFAKLTDAQKAAVTKQADTTITALDALNTKIQAETTIDAVKADIKTIYDTYHVYAVFLPQLRMSVMLTEADNILAKLDAYPDRMQKRIDADTAAGKDVTASTAALADFTAQITAAEKALAAAKIDLAKVDVTKVDVSNAALKSARTNMTDFKAAIVAALGDVKSFIPAKTTPTPTPSSTSSAKTTPSPTPSASSSAKASSRQTQ